MKKYDSGLIGMDFKPPRKVVQKNRYRMTHPRWLFPALFVLIILFIFVVTATR